MPKCECASAIGIRGAAWTLGEADSPRGSALAHWRNRRLDMKGAAIGVLLDVGLPLSL
jgi:hypothetical protein